MADYFYDGPADGFMTVVLAHGAGSPAQSPFLTRMARGLALQGLRVVRFNFPYMEARRKVPDREPALLSHWRQVIASLGDPKRLIIGGKSMGGRMASLVADETGVSGLVCLGYPFHPPGKPDRLRTAHLLNLRTAALFVQGTRDPFGTRDDVAGYDLSDSIRMFWIEGGDHSFKPRETENIERAITEVAAFAKSL